MKRMTESLRRWWLGRKLVGKHGALLLGATLFVGPLAFLILFSLLQPVFDRIEQAEVDAQKARFSHVLSAFELASRNLTVDYAVWDDMYDYVATPNRDFELQNLTPISQINSNIDYRAIIRADGRVLWSTAVDLKAKQAMPDESEKLKGLFGDHVLLQRANANRTTMSYVSTERGVYLLTTAQILRSDESGKPVGFHACAVRLDEKSLGAALQVTARLNRTVSPAASATLASAPFHGQSTRSKDSIVTQIGVFNLRKRLVATIDFSTPRTISAAGRKAIYSAAGALAVAILALSLLLMRGVRRITVRRVQRLESYVRTFRTSPRPLQPRMVEGADEIASLARQFQALSNELQEADTKLREQSYLQGKADSAAGMLHNVRNALAPLRVMQEKWLREETLPYRANMRRAVEELADDTTDPVRKTELERFLLSAARKIALTGPERLSEMEETKGSIDHIAQILSSYDFDTSGKKVVEPVDLAKLIRQEARTIDAREGSPVRWNWPEQIPEVLANRVHLAQVIGNVCVNAHEAMTAAQVPDMAISVTSDIDPAEQSVTIRISDNGDGIAADDLANIFQRGYSTREHKAGGIGMHWSANAMRAMGGSIRLESPGKGQGATAVLTLRLAEDVSLAQALAA